MIVDPFDKTYNPARQIESNTVAESQYFMAFKNMLLTLVNTFDLVY